MNAVTHLRLGGHPVIGCPHPWVGECGHFVPAERSVHDAARVTCGGCKRTRAYKRLIAALTPSATGESTR